MRLPGRDGVPLKYIFHENDIPNPTTNAGFLYDYINMAPLTGEAYVINSAQVHTIIVNFIPVNKTAEVKMCSFAAQTDGRIDYQDIINHYKGVRVHAIDITKSEATPKGLFYSEDKKTHMWWEEFE